MLTIGAIACCFARLFRHVWHPALRVVLCHASAADTRAGGTRAAAVASVLRRGDVVVTTYETLRRHRDLLLPHSWEYAILDEGHKIRNPDADITLVCKQLRTVHRLVLTGAPIQNNLRELWSVFDFVFPGRLGTLPTFEQQFVMPIQARRCPCLAYARRRSSPSTEAQVCQGLVLLTIGTVRYGTIRVFVCLNLCTCRRARTRTRARCSSTPRTRARSCCAA